jgi:hypothetical protein
MIDPEPSSSLSSDEALEIIEVSFNSDVEKFAEFKPVMKFEPVFDIVGQWKVKFENP